MIAFKSFTGEYPRTIPTLLPDTAAQAATDCDFTEGALLGIRMRTSQGSAFRTGIKAMFVYDGAVQNLYSWTRDVDAVRGPMVNDAYGRFYWTDGSTFNVSCDQTGGGGGTGAEPTTTFKVGVPTPTVAMSLNSPAPFALEGVASIAFSAGKLASDGSFTVTSSGLDADITDSGSGVAVSTPVSLQKSWSGLTISTTPGTTPVVTTTDSTTGTITSTGGNSVTYVPALKMTTTGTDGSTNVAILGADGSSTMPAALNSAGGMITFASGTLTLTLTSNSTALQNRAYTYTYVNAWGEESGPAPVFVTDAIDGQVLGFSIPNLAATGYKSISYIRIYRTASGSGGTSYLFVAQVAIGSGITVYTDSVLTSDLGETLPTMDYDCPPQTLQGLCAMNNGILAAFSGNELYFMEPYLPYAYKPSTIKPLPYKIIGICPTEGGLYVTTTAMPFLITGMTPDAMTDSKVQSVYAGVSKWAICNLGARVVYATNEGLMMLQDISGSLDLSFTFFTRNVWRDRYASKLANMHLNTHDGNIIVWFDDGTPGFMIRFEESNLSFTKLTDVIDAAFRYPVGDGLFVAYSGTVYSFNTGSSTKAFSWQSKDFVSAAPTNYAVLQLVGTGAVTYELFADGVSKATGSVTLAGDDSNVFKLPSGFKARRHSLSLTGSASATIKEAYVANSVQELRSV